MKFYSSLLYWSHSIIITYYVIDVFSFYECKLCFFLFQFVNETDIDLNTSLHFAVEKRHIAVVQKLISAGISKVLIRTLN